MEGRRRRSREFEKGETNFSRATRSATESGRSGSDTRAKGNVGTDGDGGGEPRYAARSASSAIVRGRDCVPQATAGASVQVFGLEGRREVGRDVRSVGREGRHDIQSVQVPPKRGVEPPIRARAHLSNPAFDAVRKKEVICTVESEPEFEFEYPIELRGNRLAKHILQSHTPYDPSCAVCLMSKGLKRAPKRTDQVTNEIQMDIANLCTHPKSPNMYRYVVMWNRTHGMIATAAIYVDQASTIRVLTAAINHCSSTGAMVLSDEGRDLTALISELIRLKVVSRHETSRPGRHATGAERAVRTLKTQLGCIRTVLYQHGLMLGSESLRYAAANACHVHNAFQLQANSSLTPYQRTRISVTSSGEVPNTNRVMPFGCLVFARPTDGYLEKVREANARHFVPGIYLTPKLSSLGHFVAFEGSQDETVVVPVRDLKIASPIRFVAGLGMLCEIPNSKSGVKPDKIERLPNDLSKPQKLVDLPIHEGEPPWYWSEVNKTSRCPACSNGSETGHSVKCRNRYKKYLEEEYKRIVPIEDESSVPVVPEGLEEGLDTEGKPESQQESGERVPESESEREKRKRKSIDDEWDRFHREHEEKETGERFPEFDDVPFHAPKGQEADTEPTPMQEDPTNPYEIGKNPEPIEDDRMSEGYEPTEVPEGYRAPESPGESHMDIDLFQKIPRRGKNRNHDHWEVDLDKLVLRRVHHRSRKCVFAASSLPLPMPEDQLVGIQRTYYVDAVDERPVDEIPRDQLKVHVSEFGTQTAPLRRHWKGFTELPIKQLYMYDHQGNAIASLSDLGKELWEKVKDPLSRCSDDEVERFLSSVQEGVLEYSRKVPKETEESKFDAKADSCKVWFGGRWIVLRKPSRATSDIGEGPLDVDATFEGMHTEVIALEKHRTGQVVNKNEAQEYCQMHGIRIISTRWVVVNKHDAIKGDIVRSRLVVRDFATGPSAAELGVSSPTASSEALKVVLSYLAQKSSFRKKSKKGGVGKTAWVLDVSTAFLHAPVIHPAVVSLPTGMEDEDGEPLFVILEKAMNGLRSAGMSWYRHLADLLDQEGLTACVTKKTIFAGRYRKGVAETEEENHLIVLMYVDDLLVVGDDRNIQKLVDELSKKLRLKVTGKLEEDRIRFLGKVIEKEEDGTIALYMEKEYYEGMMNLYPGGKESQATPNLFQLYDRDREEDRKPLSPEAAATFRTALGKLGWVAQSRPDLCWLCSMLARGQSQPLAVHETAMRASIRYIRSVADRKLKFRSYEYSGPPRITTYVDASWAAEESTNRKSTSGAAIFVSDCCRDQLKVHVSEFGTQTAPLRRHWKGFTELPIKQLYMYDHQGNAIASLSDLGKELWEKVKDPLSRCSDDEVERFLSSVQEGVLEYSRKVPKETEESKFDAKADSCKVWFGGRWIVLRKPSRATSDIGEGPLDVDATFEGMHTEVIALEKHRTGQVVNKNEAQEYCQMHGIRIISTRWVVVNKHDAIKGDIVRSRLVVRDFATGPSAAELGVSSPTASSEALKVVLSYLAQKSSFRKKSKKGGVGKTAWVLDVSTAFLHAPVIHPAVVSLPTGMEDEDGEPLFVILEKAMNGLRSAGMSWYRHLADLLDQEGLTACVTKKTIFAGRYRKGVAETEEENHLIVLMYVDDLLVVGDDRNIQKLVDELSKKLRLKVTGKLEEDRIRFLGKVIEKEEDGTIALYMEKEYYEGMMNLYPGGKESQATPNLFQLYDRDREEDRKPLSPEAAATFRTALGKLGWVAQSRPDLCWLCSMLARGQSQPLAVHETAMRASIRYIRSVADRKLKFRSYEYSGPPRITTYVDASWAAEESTNRKSTSGAAIFVSDCCVKAFSRLQQSVACSSAEAELYALFEGAKETIGIQHAVAHVYGCQAEELPIPGLLTDSMAARNVTEMSGLLRRLRHIDIRICFLQDAVYKGVISISFVRGTENCADLMTKALSRAVTLQHMETIGVVRAFLVSFEVPYDWIGRWLWVMDKVTCTEILIVEFCTSPESEMKEVGSRTEGVEVLTVTEADDGTRSDTIESIREQMISHRKRGKLVVLWSSIPCTGGCPFQYICIKKFGQDYMGHLRELYQIQKKLWKGFLRMSEVADFVAIEWPKRCAYWGWNQTKDFLRKRKTFSTFVDACSVKLNQKGQLVRKTWRIETDSTRLLESLKVCVCDGRHDHLPSKEVNWKETQHYPRRFCELILKGFKAELES